MLSGDYVYRSAPQDEIPSATVVAMNVSNVDLSTLSERMTFAEQIKSRIEGSFNERNISNHILLNICIKPRVAIDKYGPLSNNSGNESETCCVLLYNKIVKLNCCVLIVSNDPKLRKELFLTFSLLGFLEKDKRFLFFSSTLNSNSIFVTLSNYITGFCDFRIENIFAEGLLEALDGISWIGKPTEIDSDSEKKQQLERCSQPMRNNVKMGKAPVDCFIDLKSMISYIRGKISNENFQLYEKRMKDLGLDWDSVRSLTRDELKNYLRVSFGDLLVLFKAFEGRSKGLKYLESKYDSSKYQVPSSLSEIDQFKDWKLDRLEDDVLLIRKNLKNVISDLTEGLIGLDIPTKLCLLALLSKQNILLLGSPGVGKSLLSQRIMSLIDASEKAFTLMMTRFTIPEEVFGPISISGLKQDEMKRKHENYLPNAKVAFLDEIFKSNSAILNSLLEIINEKTFSNSGVSIKVPLLLLIGASNENFPQDLEALYDRFLFRITIPELSREEKKNMLMLADQRKTKNGGSKSKGLSYFNWKAINFFSLQADESVIIPDDIFDLLLDIDIEISQVYPLSNRRLCNFIPVLKCCVHAHFDHSSLGTQRNYLSAIDCMILRYMIDPALEGMRRIDDILIKHIGKYLINNINSNNVNRERYQYIIRNHLFIENFHKVKLLEFTVNSASKQN